MWGSGFPRGRPRRWMSIWGFSPARSCRRRAPRNSSACARGACGGSAVGARRILRAPAFSLFLAALASTASARLVDGVVAVVNDEPITFSEFRESVAEGMGVPEGEAGIHLRAERGREAVLR